MEVQVFEMQFMAVPCSVDAGIVHFRTSKCVAAE